MTPTLVEARTATRAADPALRGRLASLSAEVSAVRRLDLQESSALSAQPAAPPTDGFAALFEAELRNALRTGQAGHAFDAADALRRRTDDLGRVYRVLGGALAAATADRSRGAGTLLQEQRTLAAAASVVARLRAGTPTPPGPGTVLVTASPADPAGLALEMVAHRLEDAGQQALVVAGLTAPDLAEAVQDTVIPAVVISVQSRAGAATLRRFLTSLQQAAAHVPRLVTGPSAPEAALGATALAPDVDGLLVQLNRLASPLTARETRVLECVAAGLTNAEAAAALGVAAATVKTHLDKVFDKTGCQHRAAAVATALRRGWLR